MWWFRRSWINISHFVSCECYCSWFKFLVFQVISLFPFKASSHGLWFMIIWLKYLASLLSYGDDLNGLNMLLSLCYFITYGCWYMWWYLSLNIYAMSMVIWLHSASTYISFSDSNYLVEWYHVDGVISCSISFTFCYISGHLITLLQASISYTHTLTSIAKQDKIWTSKTYPKRTQHT
jgi:hypothetical protein